MNPNTTANVAQAVQIALELTTSAGNMLQTAAAVSALIAAAQAQGRDLTAQDFAQLDAADASAKAALDAAIAKHTAS